MRIAFLGLGIMGSPMAINLTRAGHQVIGYNRSPVRAAALVDADGTTADSIAAAVRGADARPHAQFGLLERHARGQGADIDRCLHLTRTIDDRCC